MTFSQSQHKILIMAFGIAAISAELFNSPLFIALKPLCTISILAYLLLFRNTAINSFSKRIGIGLFFCLVGDTFLLFESYFIWGLASFLVAHLIFLYAFIKKTRMAMGAKSCSCLSPYCSWSIYISVG